MSGALGPAMQVEPQSSPFFRCGLNIPLFSILTRSEVLLVAAMNTSDE
jgi:hypothetical protein